MTKMYMRLLVDALALCVLLGSVSIPAVGAEQVRVTVTNLARGSGSGDECRVGQYMGLFFFAIHRGGVRLFTPGGPASPELAILAESGRPTFLADAFAANERVCNVVTVPEPGGPVPQGIICAGESLTVVLDVPENCDRISMAAMVVPTNDGFIALNGEPLPAERQELYLNAWDAGSEVNDQRCRNIPGLPPEVGRIFPGCAPGDANTDPTQPDPNPTAGEGYVHIHSGIHGSGSSSNGDIIRVGERLWDWRNPIARVVIRRISAQ